jgi:hypothetical protein
VPVPLTDLLTRPGGTDETQRRTRDGHRTCVLVSETGRNARDMEDVRRMAHNPATHTTEVLLDLLRTEAEAAHMTDAEWCPANWYVIYPVALLPHLERDSFDYAETKRSNRCMRRGMPLRELLGRQIVRRRPRDCCYYHSVDWRTVAAEAGRIAHEVPLAAQLPPSWPEDDSDEAEDAHERAWQPHRDARDLAAACRLPEREREAVGELLSPATAIWLVHAAGSSSLGYQNGRHRAQALMSAGVRWVPVIRDHCCRAAQDCSAPHCYLLEGPLAAEHIGNCDLPSWK